MGTGWRDNSMYAPKRDERTAVADTSTHAAGITSHPLSQTRLDGYARVAWLPRSCSRDAVFDLLLAARTLHDEMGEVFAALDGAPFYDKQLDEAGRRLHALALDLAVIARDLRTARFLIWMGSAP